MPNRDAHIHALGEVGSGYPSDPKTRQWLQGLWTERKIFRIVFELAGAPSQFQTAKAVLELMPTHTNLRLKVTTLGLQLGVRDPNGCSPVGLDRPMVVALRHCSPVDWTERSRTRLLFRTEAFENTCILSHRNLVADFPPGDLGFSAPDAAGSAIMTWNIGRPEDSESFLVHSMLNLRFKTHPDGLLFSPGNPQNCAASWKKA